MRWLAGTFEISRPSSADVAPLALAPIVHLGGMSGEQTIVYLGTAVRLVGVNRFYTRRVLQRCDRGEISVSAAAQLLVAAAQQAETTTEVVGVRR